VADSRKQTQKKRKTGDKASKKGKHTGEKQQLPRQFSNYNF